MKLKHTRNLIQVITFQNLLVDAKMQIVKKLNSIGHKITKVDDAIGGGQCIKIDRTAGILIGGSDPRKDGMAVGY